MISPIKTTILLLTLFTAVFSQDQKSEQDTMSYNIDRIWISIGLGIGGEGIDNWQPYPSSGFSFNYSSGSKLLRLRYYYNSLHAPFTEQLKCVRDLGLLYGYRKQLARSAVSLSGGISLVSGYYYKWLGYYSGEEYDRKVIAAVGFPFEAQLDWSPFRKFGIGLSIYGDINTEMSFYGLMLLFNIGKLR
jgi:hypothetical protein